MSLAKRIASWLPLSWQDELKRWHFRRQIQLDRFRSDEPEFDRLDEWVGQGDWVVDVGANVGHYTKRLSDLVGVSGRVIALEPIPATFSVLAANVRLFRANNVTLYNLAASDSLRVATLRIPRFASGLLNYYQASLSESSNGSDCQVSALTTPLDLLLPGQRISLVKIDAEGHELEVLRGMAQLLRASRPTLVIEGESPPIAGSLAEIGYQAVHLAGSPNTVFLPSS